MVLDVAPDQELPLIPNTEEDYWGWLRPPAFRPLVLVNGSWTQDPDGWAESSRDSDLREQLYPAFRAVNDSVFHCPKTYLDVVFYDYQWTDLIQVGAYRDRRGRVLVGLELDINKYGCDGPPGPDWSIHWFLVAEEPVLIGNELEFVDAGDYNGDSKSEVLFWHSGYNEDGYSIFYEDFTRRSDYWWNYH